MDRSASDTTLVFTVSELFEPSGSLVEESTDAELVMVVPSGVFDWTWTGSWKVAVLPDATVGLVQVTVPFAPTAGAEQLHPAGAVIDRKTVWAGSGSVIVAEAASSGPALCTVMLYVMPPPGLMEPEPVVLEMDRSAVGGAAWLGVAMATASALITKNPVRTRRAPLATLMSPSSPAPRPRPVCGGFLMVEPRHPAAPGRERSNPGTGEVTLSGPSGFPERSPLGRCRVDPAVADRQDAVDVLQELLAVGGHQAGGSVGGDLSEGPEDFAGPPLVLVTGGLVGQQEPGADHHGPGQGHALLLAQRDLAGLALAVRDQPELVEKRGGPGPPFLVEAMGQAQGQLHVLQHRELLEQPQVLGHDGQVRPGPHGCASGCPPACAPGSVAGPGHVPAVRMLPPADHVQQGRLPGTRGADQGDHLAHPERERDPGQRADFLRPPPVRLPEVPGLEQHAVGGSGRAHGGVILTSPSCRSMTARRSGNSRSASGGSWVATTKDVPIRASPTTSDNRASPEALSSSAVGSSATTMGGPPTTAWAKASRCCSPPESWCGRWWRRAAIPRNSSSSSAPAAPRWPRSLATMARCCEAVRYGIRLSAGRWNT